MSRAARAVSLPVRPVWIAADGTTTAFASSESFRRVSTA